MLQTHIHSWWIPGTHYQRATHRGCIKTLLLQSSVRSNRRRTNTCWSNQHGCSACWQCYTSWLCDLGGGAWGAWDQKHWSKYPDQQQLYRWRTAFRDARGQRQVGWSRWWNWRERCHRHRQPATTGCNWTREVWCGNQWCQQVWGRWWGRRGWGGWGRSIANRWWINVESGGLRA